ncbi:ABC-F family ATP-binding cassette domain-containing protein [Robinsoniella sp. KNHs210]|uniref:ABC-F family ATP-binding cassette domain-containing protein n=1 Tax=Robinsoniella sp. KNHs210 TaxID=1469950 RepID=UPI000483A701|nr:ABC-F family ATP-binding cassette domain-containing protein [Robinsoniella sp. KNHs210]
MNLLTIENLTHAFTERKLFDQADFSINEGDKVGLIGINGTGKSTLLKIAAGLEIPDSGKVTKGNQVTIRFLSQNPEFNEDMTALEAVMHLNKTKLNEWSLESEAKSMLNKLEIEDFNQKISQLSGGQKKRVALANILLATAEILILDEPTNHLDNAMSEWLEEYLNQFRGALIMVTHDRYFLDRVSNRIVEIDKGQIYNYPGNYSEFVRLKEARQNMEVATERKRQSILKTELEWLARGARARSTKQKAHIARIEEMKERRGPQEDLSVEMNSISTRLGRKTIEVTGLSKSYGEKVLFRDYSYIFLKGERIGIIGPNGCGKSTLLKIINGITEPDCGTIDIGQTVKIGYFSQESEAMDDSMKVIDYIREAGEYVQTTEGTITASQMLERFLFDGTMQWNLIGKLSGGEKRRLFLLRILMTAPNVLILDEPTNDLDIHTLTILEDYLDSFDGIVITVSHDRYFLDRVVRRIFAFEGNGVIQQYEGGYSDYLIAWELRNPSGDNQSSGIQKETKNVKIKDKKLKFTYQEQKDFETIDEDIENLEEQLKHLEEEMLEAASNYGKLGELMQQKEDLSVKLDEKMQRWEYLNDLAERIEQERAGN